MKVIKSRLSTTEPKRCICEECGAELEYTKDDVYIGWMGCGYVKCPECGKENIVVDKRQVQPKYPTTFLHNKKDSCKELYPEKINEYVKQIVEGLKEDGSVSGVYMITEGNTLLFGYKNNDGIDIYVTQDYWEDTIFEDN